MNILYLMHVDWRWIKQRPHFLAEQLSKKNYVYVLYDSMTRKNVVKDENEMDNGEVEEFEVIRGGFRIPLIYWINTFRKKRRIENICRKRKIDTIIIPYPTMLPCIPDTFQGKIIYDCMDDYVSMASNIARKRVETLEAKLLKRADGVAFSSSHLQQAIIERYSYKPKFTEVVRNGYQGFEAKKPAEKKLKLDRSKFNLCYFGTISTWFDWNALLRVLDDVPEVCAHIIGPNSQSDKLPVHNRLHLYGPVQHSELIDMVKDVDCMIMPFVINPIILSVDPVKLYEYIYLNKNIICPRYPEIERFGKFSFFYNDSSEFVDIVKKMIANNTLKYSQEERDKFLESSTWAVRADELMKIVAAVGK